MPTTKHSCDGYVPYKRLNICEEWDVLAVAHMADKYAQGKEGLQPLIDAINRWKDRR